MPLCDGLWAHWKMEENTGDRLDSSPNGNDLSAITDWDPGIPIRTTGKIDYGVEFLYRYGTLRRPDTGSEVGAGPNLTGNCPFTVAFWMYIHHPANETTYFSDFYFSEYDAGITFLESAATGLIEVDAYTYGGSGSLDAITDPLSLKGGWHFFVIYFDGTGLYIEVDNALEASDPGSDSFIENAAQFLGFEHSALDPTDKYVIFDEVSIWRRSLTSDEKTSLYNGGTGYDYDCTEEEVSCNEIWGHWNLDETGGNRLDSSGNSHDLTEVDGTASYQAGLISNAAEFIDVGLDSGSIPDATGDFTVAFWFKVHKSGSFPYSYPIGLFVAQAGDPSSVGFSITLGHDESVYPNQVKLIVIINDGFVQSDLISLDAWHFAVMKISSLTGLEVYLDNVLILTNPELTSIGAMAGTNFYFGSTYYTPEFGYILIDEGSVWERALNSAEMLWLYNSGAGNTYTCGEEEEELFCGFRTFPISASHRTFPFEPSGEDNDVFRIFPLAPTEECLVVQHTYRILINLFIQKTLLDPSADVVCESKPVACLPLGFMEKDDMPVTIVRANAIPIGMVSIDSKPIAQVECQII